MPGVHYEEDLLEDDVWKRIQDLTWKARQELIDKIVLTMTQQVVRKTIQDNFTRIQMEVRSIIMAESGITQEIGPPDSTNAPEKDKPKTPEEIEAEIKKKIEEFVQDPWFGI